MVELVDTYALGAYASQRAGSSPVPGTISGLFEKFSRVSAFFITERSSEHRRKQENI